MEMEKLIEKSYRLWTRPKGGNLQFKFYAYHTDVILARFRNYDDAKEFMLLKINKDLVEFNKKYGVVQ